MTLTDTHLELAILHVAYAAPCAYGRRLLGDGASWVVKSGVAVVVNPMLLHGSCLLHLGEPCLTFQSVPLLLSPPDRHVSQACWRTIPFAALGLSHEAAA